MKELLRTLEGELIVSCQAYPGEPLRDSDAMARVAESVVLGGAVAVRAQGISDIERIRASIDVPVIGLWKIGTEGVFITPTLASALAVAHAGAHVVALDATSRERPNGEALATIVDAIHSETEALVMGDIGGEDSARYAIEAGVDVVATTLAGHTGERPSGGGPDFDLIATVAAFSPVPVIGEGRIHSPAEARQAIDYGAHAVVVGTAITHPRSITEWFVDAVRAR